MTNLMQMVYWFHTTFKRNIGVAGPKFPDKGERELRRRLLKEEFDEYELAEDTNDMVEVADALGDMAYIIAGTAISYGIPLDLVMEEIQRAQRTKVPLDGIPLIRADGKVLKPDTYVPPDIHKVLFPQG